MAVQVQNRIQEFPIEQSILDETAQVLYAVASLLNEPLCLARELYYMAEITDARFPEASRVEQVALASITYLGAFFCGTAATFTTLPGISLRYLAVQLQQNPYMYRAGLGEEKEFQDHSFSLFSWNVCGVPAGFSITDGGVLHWRYRFEKMIEQIESANADVLCLYEVFEVTHSEALYDRLKEKYPHFYLNVGMRTIGAPSGIFVASKYPIQNPKFTAFPKETLVGRTKNSEKGCFAFDIVGNGRSVSRIFSTHPQHSEVVGQPDPDERAGRQEQMNLILHAMQRTLHCTPILTGDLNFDDNEHENSDWSRFLTRGTREFSRPTWNGDRFCAALMNKPGSDPCTLDHTMTLRDRNCEIVTTNTETGFDGDIFIDAASSDHDGIYSTIQLAT